MEEPSIRISWKILFENKSDQPIWRPIGQLEFIWILKPDFVQQLILLLLQMSYDSTLSTHNHWLTNTAPSYCYRAIVLQCVCVCVGAALSS